MEVFRVEKRKYLSTMLKGIPGRDFAFRWNTKDHPIIYAAASRSLALTEKTANFSRPFYGLPSSFILAKILLPKRNYRCIYPKDLPGGWDLVDRYHPSTQEIGDAFTRSDELALFVPSTVVKGEFNVLINPNHEECSQLQVEVEEIDRRMRDLGLPR